MKKTFFLFFLFLFLNLFFSQYSAEELKISNIALDASCKKFWEKDLSKEYILSKSNEFIKLYSSLSGIKRNIYNPALFYTLESLELNNWSTSDVDVYALDLKVPAEFSKEKEKIKSAYSKVQKAKSSYAQASKFYDQITKTFGLSLYLKFISISLRAVDPLKFYSDLLNLLTFFFDQFLGGLLTNDFVDFSISWEDSMADATDSLQSCVSALDTIFKSAENKALKLYENGIEEPSYFGKPKEVYNQWKEFVKFSKIYSNPQSFDESTTPSFLYGLVYRNSNLVRDTCNLEQPFPIFYSTDEIFNTACIASEGSLLEFALTMNLKLNQAIDILEKERDEAKTINSNLKKEAEEKIKKVQFNEPLKFSQEDLFFAPTTSFKVLNVSGELNQLYNSMIFYSNQAKAYFDSAQRSKKAVEQIQLFKNSSENYRLAIQAAEQLEQLMKQKSNISCHYANSELNSLFLAIKKLEAEKNHSALGQALEIYNSASSLIQKAQSSSKESDKYLSCKEAYFLILNGQQKSAQSISISRTLLNKFLEYIVAGEKMGADVSVYKEKHAEFKKLLDLNYSLDPQDIQSNILSIKNYLHNFMEEENNLHETILELLDKSQGTQKEFLNSYNQKLKAYRENDQWNLYAFKNRNALLSFLRSSLKQLQNNLENYVKSYICKNASFYSNYQLAIVDESFKIVASWESSNPLDISFIDGLQLSCPLEADLSNSAIKEKSKNIESAIISNKTLKLVLSSLSSLEKISINFTDEKKAFSSTLQNCLLTISSSDKISLESNYSINSLYQTNSVQFYVPWTTINDNLDSKLYSQTGVYNGILTMYNSSPAIRFVLPLSSSKVLANVIVKSSLARQFDYSEQKLTPDKEGYFIYSYKLNLGKLPCKNILLERVEKFSNISNLEIFSTNAAIKNIKTYSGGELSYWKATINSQSEPIILSISFKFSDLEKWFNSSYSELLEKAKEAQDSYSLNLLESAKQSFQSKDYTSAAKKLAEVQKRLANLILKKEKIELAKEKILSVTKKIEELSGFNSTDNKKILNIKTLLNSLTNAVQSANRTLSLDPDNAIDNLEKSIEKTNKDIQKELSSLEPKTQKRLDTLISIYSKAKLDQSNLASISDKLGKIREAIIENDFIKALLNLYSASDALDKEEKAAVDLLLEKLAELNSKKTKLQNSADELIVKWDKYFSDAKLLEGAKILFRPPIASKDVQNYKKPIVNLFKNWVEENSTKIDKLALAIEKNELILSRAEDSINSSYASYSQAKAKLEEKALSLLKTAKALNSKQDSAKALEQEDIAKAEELIEKEEYGQAIVLLDRLLRASHSFEAEKEKGSLPIFEIFVSLIFILAIAYVLLQSQKKKKAQEKKEIKTLKKSEENVEENKNIEQKQIKN
ncbi:MAG: hypothetical protein N3D10_03045 [Candidatus Micrarchaeota archaeon]|nr:hypothetical protein [Candidatus Micrarchaeota archaeon]